MASLHLIQSIINSMFNQTQQQQNIPFAQTFQQNTQQQFGMNQQQPFGQQTFPFGQNQQGGFGQNQMGFAQQQNQGFNPQMVQQQMQNAAQEQKKAKEKISLDQLTKICETAFQLQGQNDFRELLTLLGAFHTNATKQIETACNESDALKRELQSHQNGTSMNKIISRCRQVKERNDYLLKRSFNIRRKLMEQTYLSKSVTKHVEKEYEILNQKIKHLKMKVSNKYTQLRFNQINRVDPNPQNEPSFNSLKTPLVELKKAVEHLKRSSALQMQDLSLLVKYIHGQNISQAKKQTI